MYAGACILEMLAIWIWRQQHPQQIGIARMVMGFGVLPAWGPIVLAACAVIEGILLWKRYRYLSSFLLGLALFACAFVVSALSYAQSPEHR